MDVLVRRVARPMPAHADPAHDDGPYVASSARQAARVAWLERDAAVEQRLRDERESRALPRAIRNKCVFYCMLLLNIFI